MYHPTGIKKLYHQIKRTLAQRWLNLYHPIQIGITGSQGKTTTSQILAKVLSCLGTTVVTDTNLDTTFNVPITALKVRPWTKFLVWELGVDHIDEMERHLEIAKPTIGIITGISPVHTDQEHFGSLENLIKEKRKIIENLPNKNEGGIAILNYDDPIVRNMSLSTKAQVFFYGSDQKNCHYCFDKKSIQISLNGTTFKLIQPNSTDSTNSQLISTKLIGRHFASNLTAVFAVLDIVLKSFLKSIQPISTNSTQSNQPSSFSILNHALKKIEPLRGRMNIEKGPLGTIILNDSLRANPKSTNEGLKTFYQIDYKRGRKIAVLGVMGELYDPINEHKKTAETIIKYPPEFVIGVGNYRRYTVNEAIRKGFPKDKIFYSQDVFEAAEILKKIIKPGDFLYLKSSLLRNLWRIIKILKGKQVCCRAEFCPYHHCRF